MPINFGLDWFPKAPLPLLTVILSPVFPLNPHSIRPVTCRTSPCLLPTASCLVPRPSKNVFYRRSASHSISLPRMARCRLVPIHRSCRMRMKTCRRPLLLRLLRCRGPLVTTFDIGRGVFVRMLYHGSRPTWSLRRRRPWTWHSSAAGASTLPQGGRGVVYTTTNLRFEQCALRYAQPRNSSLAALPSRASAASIAGRLPARAPTTRSYW